METQQVDQGQQTEEFGDTGCVKEPLRTQHHGRVHDRSASHAHSYKHYSVSTSVTVRVLEVLSSPRSQRVVSRNDPRKHKHRHSVLLRVVKERDLLQDETMKQYATRSQSANPKKAVEEIIELYVFSRRFP